MKRADRSKLSARELAEQKAFLCCSVSPNAEKEQRGRKWKGLILAALLFYLLMSHGGLHKMSQSW